MPPSVCLLVTDDATLREYVLNILHEDLQVSECLNLAHELSYNGQRDFTVRKKKFIDFFFY